MKSIALSVAVLFGASVLSAQAPVPAKPADPKAEVKTSTELKPAPAKPVDPKAVKPTDPKAVKKDDKKKGKEKEPVLPGVTIARANGTWLGLEVENGVFKLSFYDKKKKSMTPDVTRASARWPNPRAPGDNRTVLNVSGDALVGQKPVVPPYTFTVFLTLLEGDGDAATAVENYTVQMH